MAGQALEGPGQRGGGRLVAGDDQRDELVADLLVGHRRPSSSRASSSIASTSLALLEAAARAAVADQRVELGVDRALMRSCWRCTKRLSGPSTTAARGAWCRRTTRGIGRAARTSAACRSRSAGLTPSTTSRITSSAIAWVCGRRLNGAADRHPLDLGLGDARHRLALRAQACRRGTQAAAACAGACARRSSSTSTEWRPSGVRRISLASPAWTTVRRGLEDLLDRVGVGEQVPRPALDVDPERVAVARVELVEVLRLVAHEAKRLERARRARARRKADGGGHAAKLADRSAEVCERRHSPMRRRVRAARRRRPEAAARRARARRRAGRA